MKDFFKTLVEIYKDAWRFVKHSEFGAFMRDAYIGGKEFFSDIWEWVELIFQYVLYIIPMWATVHYLGWGYLILTIIYLMFGTFVAMFNDAGPYWLSYILLLFWLPMALISIFIIEPGKWLLRLFGFMKPKYTPGEIKLSKHLAEQGKKIIEKREARMYKDEEWD